MVSVGSGREVMSAFRLTIFVTPAGLKFAPVRKRMGVGLESAAGGGGAGFLGAADGADGGGGGGPGGLVGAAGGTGGRFAVTGRTWELAALVRTFRRCMGLTCGDVVEAAVVLEMGTTLTASPVVEVAVAVVVVDVVLGTIEVSVGILSLAALEADEVDATVSLVMSGMADVEIPAELAIIVQGMVDSLSFRF